ncbi:MAG: 4-(cytidine 5-diphospho)-2-C-methyl-D-erythritol kinase [Actinomycetota bacterium]
MTTALAQGKINLVFQVGPLNAGYHEVRSIYQAIDLAERVTVEVSTDWEVEVLGELPNLSLVPLDQTNIVIKAARALAQSAGIDSPQPMRFLIEKQIPVAGGMAGGSADAAAALVALNEHWCLGKTAEQLAQVGSLVGADVPFALLGGTALGVGTGTILTKLEACPELHIVLIINESPLSTKSVFERFDLLYPQGQKFSDSLSDNFMHRLGENSLLEPAMSLQPALSEILSLDLGISGGFLSGSGPTVWFASESFESATAAFEKAKTLGYHAVQTKTSTLGARLS